MARKVRKLSPGFRPSQQTTGGTVSLLSVMNSAPFVAGFKSAREGKPFDPDRFADLPGGPWNYERGRLLALLYDGALKEGRRVTGGAYRAYVEARKAGEIC